MMFMSILINGFQSFSLSLSLTSDGAYSLETFLLLTAMNFSEQLVNEMIVAGWLPQILFDSLPSIFIFIYAIANIYSLYELNS